MAPEFDHFRTADPPSRAVIVGLGSMGRRHLANLRALSPTTQIAVLRRASAPLDDSEQAADRVFHRLDDALAFAPQAAIIASPAPFHVDTALAFARRGVHLCIEKPLSHRLDGIDELVAACARTGAALLTAYNFRFCESLERMRNLIASGQIGRVLSLRAEVGQYLPDWRPGRDYRHGVSARREMGGGVLLELSHEVDYARWLAGEVASVSAATARVSDLEIDVEDLAEITLGFASGAIGSIHLDMVSPAPGRICRVIGSTGVAEWNAMASEVRLFTRESGSWRTFAPAGSVDRNAMYLEEMRHFLACAAGQAKPRVSGREGRRTLEIVLAAREAAQRGRTIHLTPMERAAAA